MLVIAVQSQKGGSGKSTLAINLAVAAVEVGYASGIIDADTQCTALSWSQLRAPSHAWPLTRPYDDRRGEPLPDLLAEARLRGVSFLVVDTPPSDKAGPLLRQIASISSAVVVPCKPRASDLWRVPDTLKLIPDEKPVVLALNECSPRRGYVEPPAVREALRAAADIGVSPARQPIRRREIYDIVMNEGLGVCEAEPDGPAAAEVRSLLKDLFSLTGRGRQSAVA